MRWISGYCWRDISEQAVCYMFNMHTCASGMTRVNNISDFSFSEKRPLKISHLVFEFLLFWTHRNQIGQW